MSGSGREQKLVDYIFGLPSEKLDSIRGNPTKVLEVIDDFSDNQLFLMNIGPNKGKPIVDLIHETKPKIMIELGGFVGYSAILFASNLGENAQFHSFELSQEFADIASKIVDLAGLSHKVEFHIGQASETLPKFQKRLSEEGNAHIDLVFVDHYDKYYVPDLRVLESLKLIGPGSILVADNIYIPGAPEYLEYIKSTPEAKKEYNLKTENISGKEYPGRWNIVYETTLIEALLLGKTDAIAITKFVKVLDE